jgi:hypothetical protein
MRIVRFVPIVIALLPVFACGMIAGVDGYTADEDVTVADTGVDSPAQRGADGSARSDAGTASDSGASTPSDGGASVDAGAVDAAPDTYVPGCTKLQNGSNCNDDPTTCCTNTCDQTHACAKSCIKSQGFCGIGASNFPNGCCYGYYCGSDGFCAPCITAGQNEGTIPATGILDQYSCCSGNADNGVCK